MDYTNCHLAKVKYGADCEYHRNKSLRRILKLVRDTILVRRPTITLADGREIILYNNPRISSVRDFRRAGLDYAINYTSYSGENRELFVEWKPRRNEISIEDTNWNPPNFNCFLLFHYHNKQVDEENEVNQEEDIIPLLKEWLCIPKTTEFDKEFNEVKKSYFKEKQILAERKAQYEHDMNNILRFMAAASLEKNYDDKHHPMMQLAGDPDFRDHFMRLYVGSRPTSKY